MIKRLSMLLVLLLGGVFLASQANAAILQTAYLTLSNPRTAAVGVTHEFTFTHITENLGSMHFQYCVSPSGTCADSGADGSTATNNKLTISGGSNDLAQWTTSWDAGNRRFALTRSSVSASGVGTVEVDFESMTNPTKDNCTNNSPANYSTGTCYVRITTYPATNWSGSGDSSIVSLTVTQAVTVTARVDPTFTVRIEGVNGGQTINGTPLSANINSTVTTLPFGNIPAGSPFFAAHLITVTGNNQGGYTVTAKMDANMAGTAYGHDIDEFIGNAATTTQSQAWTAPTGGTSGTNTGWLGVGTDDTGVSNRGANQFFTLGTTGTVVAKFTGPASARASNVVYGIQVNPYQQSDSYTGTLTYNALPSY